jgi:N-acetylmuramoyl-L-alanine amidase
MRNKNYRVFLTRDDDRFVPLKERVNFAESKNADLFISIHADASNLKSTSGFSIYTLSKKGLDREAEKLASRENSYSTKKNKYSENYLRNAVNPKDYITNRNKLRSAQENSSEFATLLVKRVSTKTSLLKNPTRYAGFAVLKSSNFPSVLVELGFVTNDYDRKNLRSGNWLTNISHQFVDAINKHFN